MVFKKGEELTPKVEQLKLGEGQRNEAVLDTAQKMWEGRPEHTKQSKSEFSQEMRNLDKQLHAPDGMLKDKPDVHVVGYTKGDKGADGLLVTSDKEKGVVYSLDAEGKVVNRFEKINGHLQKDEKFGVENRVAEPAKAEAPLLATEPLKTEKPPAATEKQADKLESPPTTPAESSDKQGDKSPKLETTFKGDKATTTLTVGSGEQWATTNGWEWKNPNGDKIYGRASIHKDAQGNVDDVTISSMEWKTWSNRGETKFNADGTTDSKYHIHGTPNDASWHLNDKGMLTQVKNHYGQEYKIGYAPDGITPNKFTDGYGETWTSSDNKNWNSENATYNVYKVTLGVTRGNPTAVWEDTATGYKKSTGYYAEYDYRDYSQK